VELKNHKSLLQFARYLVVGGFNTVFGYGIFALLNWSFAGLGTYSYMYASFLASLIGITVSFLCYKWFVFHTRGNYLVEWLRCVGVYSSMIIVGLVGLPILVPILRTHLEHPERASYLAAGIMTGITVILSFFGHKNVSFRQKLAESATKAGGSTPCVSTKGQRGE
jgi:putative flippase GtrA